MEKRRKVREIGSYNPKTQKFEDSWRWEDTGSPVEPEPVDIKRVRTLGNYNAATDEWEEAYEDRSIEELE